MTITKRIKILKTTPHLINNTHGGKLFVKNICNYNWLLLFPILNNNVKSLPSLLRLEEYSSGRLLSYIQNPEKLVKCCTVWQVYQNGNTKLALKTTKKFKVFPWDHTCNMSRGLVSICTTKMTPLENGDHKMCIGYNQKNFQSSSGTTLANPFNHKKHPLGNGDHKFWMVTYNQKFFQSSSRTLDHTGKHAMKSCFHLYHTKITPLENGGHKIWID